MAVRRRGWLWRGVVAGAVFCLVLLGWGGWRGLRALLASDFLTVRYLEIQGCRVLPPDSLRLRLEPLLGRPLFAVDVDSLVGELETLPRVETARLQRRLPATLRCSIVEREAVALLFDRDLEEVDAGGRRLRRFGDPPPDLPIIRAGTALPADSLLGLSIAVLAALKEQGFDLSREVSELCAEDRGMVYTRNEGETRVIMGWEDFEERARTYAQVAPKIAEQGYPRELDLRFRDQVIARQADAGVRP